MIRTVFAMAVAALLLAAVSGTSQAAPIAPLSAGAASGQGTYPGILAPWLALAWRLAWWLASPLASLLVAPRLSRLRLVGTRRLD